MLHAGQAPVMLTEQPKVSLLMLQDGFLVESPSGQRWQDVDLSEDWAEYDEKLGDSVSIMELEHRFIPHR